MNHLYQMTGIELYFTVCGLLLFTNDLLIENECAKTNFVRCAIDKSLVQNDKNIHIKKH